MAVPQSTQGSLTYYKGWRQERWLVTLPRTDKMRQQYTILGGNLVGKDHLGAPFIDVTETLRASKCNSQRGCGPDFIDWRQALLANSWEGRNELLGSIKGTQFLYKLHNFKFLKDCALCRRRSSYQHTTQTHTQTYIYMCVCVCVCVCPTE